MHPKFGITNSEHNYWGSLEASGLATQDRFHFDEYLYFNPQGDPDKALLQFAAQVQPDLIFMINYYDPPYRPKRETLAELKNIHKIPMFVLWSDSVQPFFTDWYEAIADLCDLNVTADRTDGYVDRVSRPETFMTLWVPQDPRVYFDPGLTRDIDVSFTGSLNNYSDRSQAITDLRAAGIKVEQRGGQREKRVPVSVYARTHMRSKIALSFPGNCFKKQLKGRTFEIAMCGALLMDEENDQTNYYFEPGREYVPFHSNEELADKARYYLKNESEGRQIAERARDKASLLYSGPRYWQLVLSKLGLIDKRTQYFVPVAPAQAPALSIKPKPKILMVMLEYLDWQSACRWSYPAGLAIEEGLESCGVDLVSLLAMYGQMPSDPASMLYHAKRLCAGMKFDQVWFEAEHSMYDPEFLDWLASIAPIRVAIVPESLTLNPAEMGNNPQGTKRRVDNRERNFKCATHFLFVDEKDVENYNTKGDQPAFWWGGHKMPIRYLYDTYNSPTYPIAFFWGSTYGDRKRWLDHPSLKEILYRPEVMVEASSQFPQLYDHLIQAMNAAINSGNPPDWDFMHNWDQAHRQLRRDSYHLVMDGIRLAAATVNLPQFGQFFPSRVIEGMSAGRPVISWRMPDRPKTNMLFRDGIEILHYDMNEPEHLAEQIKRVQNDPALARRLVEAARGRVLRYHTIEWLAEKMLDWLETGKHPEYFD